MPMGTEKPTMGENHIIDEVDADVWRLWAIASEKPSNGYWDRLGTWLTLQGACYITLGLLGLFVPWALEETIADPLGDNDAARGWLRAAWFVVAYVGGFYFLAGAGNAVRFAASTVFMRWFLVPPAILFLIIGEHIPLVTGIFFGVVDVMAASLTGIAIVLISRSDPLCDDVELDAGLQADIDTGEAAADTGEAGMQSVPNPMGEEQEQDVDATWAEATERHHHVSHPSHNPLQVLWGHATHKRRHNDDATKVGRTLLTQGACYIVIGLLGMLAPVVIEETIADPLDSNPQARGWLRTAWFVVAYIGCFYIFAGLEYSFKFAACTVFMRVFVDPPAILFMVIGGHLPLGTGLFFGLGDMLLAGIMVMIILSTDVHSDKASMFDKFVKTGTPDTNAHQDLELDTAAL